MELIATDLSQRYLRRRDDIRSFEAVHSADLTMTGGEMIVLTGRSGSGKTTLLTMLAGLLHPSKGSVTLEGQDIYSLPDTELSHLRARRFAVVPQAASAVASLTAEENILLSASLAGKTLPAQKAHEWMEQLDILSLRRAWPQELSGGELRRVAICRALAAEPDFLFADEPTADLDDDNTVKVLSLLRDRTRHGAAVFVVTHEQEAAKYADRILRMQAGRLTEEQAPGK